MPTLVKQVMSASAERIHPHDTIQQAAKRMKDADIGFLIVYDAPAGVVGVLTDRDLALRAVAAGRDPVTTEVYEVMTSRVVTCQDEDEIADAGHVMEAAGIRRLIVLSSDRELVGVLSVDDLVGAERIAGEVVHGASHHPI